MATNYIVAVGRDPKCLLKAFATELENLAPDAYDELLESWDGDVIPEGAGQSWYRSKDASDRLEALWTSLEENTMGGYYFGTARRGGTVVYGFFPTGQTRICEKYGWDEYR